MVPFGGTCHHAGLISVFFPSWAWGKCSNTAVRQETTIKFRIFYLALSFRFSPFDDERARGPSVLIEVGAPVGAVDGAGPPARGHERVCLDAVVHRVAGADALLVVADVEDALRSELVCVCFVLYFGFGCVPDAGEGGGGGRKRAGNERDDVVLALFFCLVVPLILRCPM